MIVNLPVETHQRRYYNVYGLWGDDLGHCIYKFLVWLHHWKPSCQCCLFYTSIVFPFWFRHHPLYHLRPRRMFASKIRKTLISRTFKRLKYIFINGDRRRTPALYFLLTSSMHHPKILAILMFSSVCSSTGASNLYDIGTASPRFIFPPSILYWRH